MYEGVCLSHSDFVVAQGPAPDCGAVRSAIGSSCKATVWWKLPWLFTLVSTLSTENMTKRIYRHKPWWSSSTSCATQLQYCILRKFRYSTLNAWTSLISALPTPRGIDSTPACSEPLREADNFVEGSLAILQHTDQLWTLCPLFTQARTAILRNVAAIDHYRTPFILLRPVTPRHPHFSRPGILCNTHARDPPYPVPPW